MTGFSKRSFTHVVSWLDRFCCLVPVTSVWTYFQISGPNQTFLKVGRKAEFFDDAALKTCHGTHCVVSTAC
jgi:hypothetical protein